MQVCICLMKDTENIIYHGKMKGIFYIWKKHF